MGCPSFLQGKINSTQGSVDIFHSAPRMRSSSCDFGGSLNVESPGHSILSDRLGVQSELQHAALLSFGGMPDNEISSFCNFAADLGSDPVDLALGTGKISEVRLLERLACAIGGDFSADPPAPVPGTHAEEAFALRSYLLGGHASGATRVISPGGVIALMLLRRFGGGTGKGIVLTTRQAMLTALVLADGERISGLANATLPPMLTAAPVREGEEEGAPGKGVISPGMLTAGLVGILAVLALALPAWAFILLPLLLAPVFIIAAISVLTAALETLFSAPVMPVPPAVKLPRYTLLIPLYGEAGIAAALIARLALLDYPRDRLEIFILLESDDELTIRAFDALALPATVLIMKLPAGQPRTKLRALNAALPFASGDLLVVYDAEDAPEPDQLLKAAALFAQSSPRLACAQGRLAISNIADGLLTRRYAIEYAALFDCVKSGSARLDWPVPLGGSSNHFRTATLRRVGGWDAWNVTEDADLGVRLARFGYRVADLASTTWEEAPNTLSGWMNQRTRWMKGWMQSLLVHTRSPGMTGRQLGAFKAMVLLTTAISVLLGALLFPVFVMALAYRFSTGVPLGGVGGLLDLADAMIVLSLIMAVLVETVPTMLALWRRRALRQIPFILLAPISYVLISIAAWRALVELILRPYHWHKTNHGTAKTEGGLGRLDG